MATSGSYDYNVTARQIIEGSLRVLGVVDSDTDPSASMLNDGMEALNLLIKSWMHSPNPGMRGLQVWHRLETTLDTSALTAKQAYVLAPSGGDHTLQVPVDILAVVAKDSSGNRTMLERVTFSEFLDWSNRTDTSDPISWFYERGTSSGTLYFNTIPVTLTTDFVVTYIRPLQDIDALTNDVEFPKEWFRALKYNLAVDMAPEYGIEVGATLAALAQGSLAMANFVSPEEETIYFQPGID